MAVLANKCFSVMCAQASYCPGEGERVVIGTDETGASITSQDGRQGTLMPWTGLSVGGNQMGGTKTITSCIRTE